MRYRKLVGDALDMSFGAGSANYIVDAPEGVAQLVLTRLRLWYGEWWLDTSDGTPWLQEVLGVRTIQTRDAAIRLRALNTQGVRSIVEYSSSFDAEQRTFSVNIKLDTIYGTAVVTGAL